MNTTHECYISFSIQFRVFKLCYKSLHGKPPQYLQGLLLSPKWQLIRYDTVILDTSDMDITTKWYVLGQFYFFYANPFFAIATRTEWQTTVDHNIFAVLDFIGFIYFSTAVVAAIRKHQKVISVGVVPNTVSHHNMTKKDSIKKAKSLGIMLMFMFACYIPFLVLNILDNKTSLSSEMWFLMLHKCARVLCLSNNVANPLIYGWRDKKMKYYFVKTLKCE